MEGSAFDYETITHSSGERKVCLLVDAVDSGGASASFSDYCVQVTDVNEPPLLSTTIFNVAEGDRTDRLKLGTIEAVDKDAADAGGVTYTIKPDKWVSSTAGACPFELVAVKCPEAAASSTALTCRDVYLKSPGLDYEALLSQYGAGIFDHSASRMTVEVNLADSDPARIASPAVALLLIDVLNVNEAPSISASSISIPESVAVGSTLGAPIAVTDPDEVQRDLVFRIITDPSKKGQITGDMVSIEASGGKQAVLKLKTPGSFDFENLVEYELVIEAEDGGNAVRSQPSQKSQTTLKVTITNVNDVTVTSVVYKTAAVSPTVAGHPASGGDTVVITGTNFGPTTAKQDWEKAQGIAASVAPIVVTYGAGQTDAAGTVTYTDFTAQNCVVSSAVGVGNTQIECETESLGKQVKASELRWVVKVGGDTTLIPSTQTTTFRPPAITGVSVAAKMSTRGGDEVVITGTDFGAASPFLRTGLGNVDYSVDLVGAQGGISTPTACVSSAAGTVLTCTSAAGTGTNLQWRVTTGGQLSAAFSSTAGYDDPSIASVIGADASVDASELHGVGQQKVLLRGDNFGPIGTVVGATYGEGGAGYTAEQCTVTVAHATIECTTVAGSGTGHAWKVYVQTGDTLKQWSGANSGPRATTGYKPPAIVSVAGSNIGDLRTEGNQEIVIRGSDFGAATEEGLDCAHASRAVLRYGGSAASASVVKYGTATELTARCCKIINSNLASCLSTAGVGRDFTWSLTIGGQASNAFASEDTGYAAPVLVMYTGAGAKEAVTEGGQDVIIEGRNFGPASLSRTSKDGVATVVPLASISKVTYGKHGTEYEVPVAQCSISTNHFFVTCKTVPGAGKGLKWFINIDGQQSITPSTYFGAPAITSIVGPSLALLSTSGKETITLKGSNFGPSPLDAGALTKSPVTGLDFLEKVTYGPNGIEYAASGCEVTVNSKEITCTTVAGVGAALKWVVTVEGQSSAEFAWSSYEPPVITSMVPVKGPTSGQTDAGARMRVEIKGKGFGVNDLLSSLRVKFGTSVVLNAADPSGVGAMSTGANLPGGLESVSFELPEWYGKDLPVKVSVHMPSGANLDSNPVLFSYAAPIIDLLTTKWHDASAGLLAVTADGSNFCAGPTKQVGCGALFVNGALFGGDAVLSWSHTKVVFTTSLDKGDVSIKVGTQQSNAWTFAHLSPTINTETYDDLSKILYDTKGGSEYTIKGAFFGQAIEVLRVTVGGTGGGKGAIAAEIVNYIPGATLKTPDRLTIKVPAGQGKDQELIVWRGKQPSPAAKLSYHRPAITKIIATDQTGKTTDVAPLCPTTGGVKLSIAGTNFGLSGKVQVGSQQVATTTHTHTLVEFIIPPGEGKDLALVLIAGNQQSEPGPTIGYQPPSIGGFSLAPPSGRRLARTRGSGGGGGGGDKTGMRRLLASVTSPAPSAVAPAPAPAPTSTSTSTASSSSAADGDAPKFNCPLTPPSAGGRRGRMLASLPPGPTLGGDCIVIRGSNLGLSPPTVMFGSFPAIVVARDEVKHEWVIFASPPGEGSNLHLTIGCGSGESAQTVSVPYNYAAPTVYSISPNKGSTAGLDYSVDPKGQPVLMTLVGKNFGRPEADREVRITPHCKSCAAEGRAPYVIRVPKALFVQSSQSHSKLQFPMPEGYGVGARVTLYVTNQTSEERITFDYSVPTITKVTPYCGKRYKCRSPIDEFDTDGCADLLLWEDFTEWQARRSAAQSAGVISDSLDRKCGYDNDRWQLAIIEGTSLGSNALALAGAPLKVGVNHPNGDMFELITQGDSSNGCLECVHSHTRIVARSPWGYGKHLNLTVALGDSTSNALEWTFKKPECRVIDSSSNSVISSSGASGIVLRGRNFGKTSHADRMKVRVFIGTDYTMGGQAVGFKYTSTQTQVDIYNATLAATGAWNIGTIEGASMKECHTIVTPDGSTIKQFTNARWHMSYNYTIKGARNVDGQPYISCTPAKDVSGPKNVTIIMGGQLDR